MNDAIQMARITKFTVLIVIIFLKGNVTRQNRSNAIAVSVSMEQETVESEIKLADLQTIIPGNPSNQWY